ncbi:MAG: hypothetical protein IKU28_02310, partial [Erysipelotrichaceae bacterium]|nr:hypothetical protein [Erysipelotrichaceae bacterium]
MKKKILLVLVLFVLILRSFIPLPHLEFPVTGIVSKVYDASFQIRTLYGTVQCITDQPVSLDSVVKIEGTLIENQSFAFTPVTSVSDYAVVADRVEIQFQLCTLRFIIDQRIMKNDDSLTQNYLKKSILRLSSNEESLESLDSIQLVMMISVLKELFRKFLSDKKWRKVESFLIVFFCMLWNMPFVCFRLFYFRKMKTYPISNYDVLGIFGVLVYLISASLASSSSFWFVFLLRMIAASIS